MSEVYVKENESLDNALKRFKRSCAKAGVLADLRKKEYYQSPSVKRRKRARQHARTRISVTINSAAKFRIEGCGIFLCSEYFLYLSTDRLLTN